MGHQLWRHWRDVDAGAEVGVQDFSVISVANDPGVAAASAVVEGDLRGRASHSGAFTLAFVRVEGELSGASSTGVGAAALAGGSQEHLGEGAGQDGGAVAPAGIGFPNSG